MNELGDFIRRFVLSLRLRAAPMLAVLAQNKGATSLGAIAGLAIALVCTWRYISHARGRRRAGKRDGAPRRPGSGSGSGIDSDVASASGVSRTITHASKRGGDKQALRESSPPVQYTLSQYIRRQLNGARKMTVYMPGIVLIESTPEELQIDATVKPDVVEVLIEIARICDLYLLARVNDDASENAVRSALEGVGLFVPGALNRNKVLFCSSEIGKTSFVRQLEPDWHVDSSSETISQLARFVKKELHVTPTGSGVMGANIVSAVSLESFFRPPSV